MTKLNKKPKPGIYSMSRDIAERKACPRCGHLHRRPLRNVCTCCGHDYEHGYVDF